MKRIIAKIDIKSGHIIKGIEFECVRKVGEPIETAYQYYLNNVDEIIYLVPTAAYALIMFVTSLIFVAIVRKIS